VPIGEVTLDWFVIPQEVESYVNDSIETPGLDNTNPELKHEVLVVAIHNDVLFKYRDILARTEIPNGSFEMEIFSSIRSSLGHEISPVIIMDFGASKTKIYIVEAGIVLVFHIINRGSQDITRNISQALGITFEEAEKMKRSVGLDTSLNKDAGEIALASVDFIIRDTNSVVFAYEKRYNKNVSKVILIGGGSLLKGLIEYVRENSSTEVVYGHPFAKTEAPAFLESVLEASGPEFSVAVGLALRQLSQQ
jgi:cell division ATPase FtsA